VTILPVLTALAVFPPGAYDELGTDGIDWSRGFKGGNWVPFCGNVVVEKLECEEADYVRVLSNQMPGTSPFPSQIDLKFPSWVAGTVRLVSRMVFVKWRHFYRKSHEGKLLNPGPNGSKRSADCVISHGSTMRSHTS
jgi:hypothetical protein